MPNAQRNFMKARQSHHPCNPHLFPPTTRFSLSVHAHVHTHPFVDTHALEEPGTHARATGLGPRWPLRHAQVAHSSLSVSLFVWAAIACEPKRRSIAPWRYRLAFAERARVLTHILELVHPAMHRDAKVAAALPVVLDDLAREEVADLLLHVLLHDEVETGRAVLGRHGPRERGKRLEVAPDRLRLRNWGEEGGAECRLAADAVGVALEVSVWAWGVRLLDDNSWGVG